MSNEIGNEKRFTATETSKVLWVSSQTVRSLIHQGHLKATRIGNKFMISRTEIERYISENTTRNN